MNDDPGQLAIYRLKNPVDFMNFQNDLVPKFQALNLLAQMIQMGDEKQNRHWTLLLTSYKMILMIIKNQASSPVSTLVILSTIGLTEDVALLEKRVNMLTSEATANVFGGHLKRR